MKADALQSNPNVKVLAFLQAETSTGVQSDAKVLAEIARRQGALTIVDAVTSLAGTPLLVDDLAWTRCIPAAKNACRARRACRG